MYKYIISTCKHLATITKHKLLVLNYCFRAGLYSQGILHDLSKYSPTEMRTGIKYFVGYCSPIDIEKKENGYSSGWLHHKGRNKHHVDYWIDKTFDSFTYIEIPKKYIKEMVCDRVAASKIYLKEKYTDDYPYEYFINGIDIKHMNINSSILLKEYLEIIKDHGIVIGLKIIKGK